MDNTTKYWDSRTALLAAGLVILLLVMGILGTARLYVAQKHEAESATAKLTRTQQKLDYYLWRDSESIGHRSGPEAYKGPFKP